MLQKVSPALVLAPGRIEPLIYISQLELAGPHLPSRGAYMAEHEDVDLNKGAIEQDRPSQETNISLPGQLPHRNENPTIKARDTDYPGRGETPEHSGEVRGESLLEGDCGCEPRQQDSPEGRTQDQEPGQYKKRNQSAEKDDPLAA